MNRKSIIIISIFVVSVLQANTCGKTDPDCPAGYHQSILISNQSNKVIRYELYWQYPDTSIGEYNPLRNGTDGLSPGEEFNRSAGPRSCWESLLKDGRKHWIHFFDNDSLEAIPWDVIRTTERGLLERRLIDLDYLTSNDFKVVYQ